MGAVGSIVVEGGTLVEVCVVVTPPCQRDWRRMDLEPQRRQNRVHDWRRVDHLALGRVDSAAADGAAGDIDLEDLPQEHRPRKLLNALAIRLRDKPLLYVGLQHDLATPLAVRREDPEIAGEVDVRRRDERNDLFDQFLGREQDGLATVVPRNLELVDQVAVGGIGIEERQTLVGEGSSRTVADQFLEFVAFLLPNVAVGVECEEGLRDRARRQRRRDGRPPFLVTSVAQGVQDQRYGLSELPREDQAPKLRANHETVGRQRGAETARPPLSRTTDQAGSTAHPLARDRSDASRLRVSVNWRANGARDLRLNGATERGPRRTSDTVII